MDTIASVGVTAGAVGVSLLDRLNSALLPFFGVPATVVTMAIAGAGVSFIHGASEPDVKKMFKLIFANTFVSLLFVVIIPKMFHMEWVEPGIPPALAAGVAWISRWAIPAVIKRAPDIVKKTFGLKEYSDSGYSAGSSRLRNRYYEDKEE